MLERFTQARSRRGRIAERDLRLAADDGRGRPQLMAELGEEQPARLVDLRQLPAARLDLAGARLHLGFQTGVGVRESLALGRDLGVHAIEGPGELLELGKAPDLHRRRRLTPPGPLGGAFQQPKGTHDPVQHQPGRAGAAEAAQHQDAEAQPGEAQAQPAHGRHGLGRLLALAGDDLMRQGIEAAVVGGEPGLGRGA